MCIYRILTTILRRTGFGLVGGGGGDDDKDKEGEEAELPPPISSSSSAAAPPLSPPCMAFVTGAAGRNPDFSWLFDSSAIARLSSSPNPPGIESGRPLSFLRLRHSN